MCYTHKKFKAIVKSYISIEKVHSVIEFIQNAWLKLYIDMNTDRRKTKQKFIL